MGLAAFNRMRALQAQEVAREVETEEVKVEEKPKRKRTPAAQKEGKVDEAGEES